MVDKISSSAILTWVLSNVPYDATLVLCHVRVPSQMIPLSCDSCCSYCEGSYHFYQVCSSLRARGVFHANVMPKLLGEPSTGLHHA